MIEKTNASDRMFSYLRGGGFVVTGPGWHGFVVPLLEIIQLCGAQINQVKEKYGGLRVYASNVSPALFDLIDLIEDHSELVCEDCGEPGCPRTDLSWIRTLCGRCYAAKISRETVSP